MDKTISNAERIRFLLSEHVGVKFENFDSRPFVQDRLVEMKKAAELESGLKNVNICTSDYPFPFAMAVFNIPGLGGNKIIVSPSMINLLNDRELVAILGHELTHLEKNNTHLTRACLPHVVAGGTAIPVAKTTYKAMKNSAPHDTNQTEKPRKFFNRRALFRGTAATLLGLEVGEGFVAPPIGKYFRSFSEIEADDGGINRAHDPEAFASALLKIKRAYENLGFDIEQGPHGTMSGRIRRQMDRAHSR